MEDLSLHILDIAENSVTAGASTVSIVVREDTANDRLTIVITDNGKGMDVTAARSAADPFYTTRTTRRVGLGVPLLAEAARAANGNVAIESAPGSGTTVTATFQLTHIDRKPLGNMAETITALMAGNPAVDIDYRHERDGEVIRFGTQEVRELLGDVPVNTPEVVNFVRKFLVGEERELMSHA